MSAAPPPSPDLHAQSRNACHVLTITPFYPVAGDDARGCFIAEPLLGLNTLGVQNSVIAVQPFYRGRVTASRSAPPAHWTGYLSLPGNFGLPASGAFLFAALLPGVRKLHRETPVQVIHAHSALPCGHAAVLLGRELQIPSVVTVHGLDAFFRNQVHGYAGKWCERVAAMVYRSAARVVCVSEKVRGQVIQGRASAGNTVVVPNGVDPQLFAPVQNESEVTGAILSVGNLIPIKGHELLLRAFAAIHQRPQDACLEIIGEGPELPRLRELATSLAIVERVRFLGRQNRNQVAEAMRRCTLFALPSRYEGLGCVYLEAMSAGKAAVACRGQGIEEVIENGQNGVLILPNDLPALTQVLSDLLRDPALRQRMGAAARRTILQNFTLAHQAERLAQIYREFCA